MKTLSIIGAGNAGRTIAKLFAAENLCGIGRVLNRSRESSTRAVDFIGSGEPATDVDDIQWDKTEILLIGTSDNALEECVHSMRLRDGQLKDVIVFHLSGSIPSTVLSPLRKYGASIAGVHPIKTFSDPRTAFSSFKGTYCGMEGDKEAVKTLEDLFTGIGANVFSIKTEEKVLYHAASVFICNYFYALMDIGLNIYEEAGVERETAMKAVQPILMETIQNAAAMGPAKALTGPIARGDANVIEKQMRALAGFRPEYAEAYSVLGKATADLAKRKGTAKEADLQEILKRLNKG